LCGVGVGFGFLRTLEFGVGVGLFYPIPTVQLNHFYIVLLSENPNSCLLKVEMVQIVLKPFLKQRILVVCHDFP